MNPATTEQKRVTERQHAELEAQRTALLLKLSKDPASEALAQQLAENKRLIDAAARRHADLCESELTADAARTDGRMNAMRAEVDEFNRQAIKRVREKRPGSGAKVNSCITALRDALYEYKADGVATVKLVRQGVQALVPYRSFRHGDLLAMAAGHHGTVDGLLSALGHRDVLELDLEAHSLELADRFASAIAKTMHELDHGVEQRKNDGVM